MVALNSRILGMLFCGIAWALGSEAYGEGVIVEDAENSAGLGLGQKVAVIGEEKKMRIATVNIQEIFRSYHKVAHAEGEINIERARVQKEQSQHALKLRAMDQVLRELESSLQGLNKSDVRRPDLEREKGVRFHERERWKRQRDVALKARHADINRRMVARMEILLEEIRGLVRLEAERMGFDLVFDVDGTGSSQVPFLLFARDAHDITPRIIKKLAESASQGAER